MSQPGVNVSEAVTDASGACQSQVLDQSVATSLHSQIKSRLASGLDDDVQIELIQVNRLLLMNPVELVNRYRFQFELIFQVIAESPSDISLIRGLRFNLTNALDSHVSGFRRVVRSICGRTPLTAVISALMTIFVMLLVFSFVVVELHRSGIESSTEMAGVYYALLMIKDLPISSIMIVVHAAFIGSVISVITRVSTFLELVMFTPLLIYFSVLTRPLIAVGLAIFIFTVMKAGIISTFGADLDGPSGDYFLYAISFLCGFSERFANDFVARASQPLSGGEPRTLPRPPRNAAE